MSEFTAHHVKGEFHLWSVLAVSGKGGRKDAKPFKNISQKDNVLVTRNSLQGCRQSLSIVNRQKERGTEGERRGRREGKGEKG